VNDGCLIVLGVVIVASITIFIVVGVAIDNAVFVEERSHLIEVTGELTENFSGDEGLSQVDSIRSLVRQLNRAWFDLFANTQECKDRPIALLSDVIVIDGLEHCMLMLCHVEEVVVVHALYH